MGGGAKGEERMKIVGLKVNYQENPIGIELSGITFSCLAHGRAVKRFRSLGMKGKIGIVLNMSGHYPADEKQEQKDAAERLHQANNAWFAEPIFKGTYPQEILDWYRRKGLMPEISKEEMEEIKQPMDFLGINHYFCVKDSYREGAFPLEAESRPWGTDFTEMGWGIYPQGFYDLLIRLNQDYGNIPIYNYGKRGRISEYGDRGRPGSRWKPYRVSAQVSEGGFACNRRLRAGEGILCLVLYG